MKRMALIALIVTAQVSGFSSEIAGTVSPSPNPPPALTPDSDDDVIIMEEDSDYEENEEEDAHDNASKYQVPPGEEDESLSE